MKITAITRYKHGGLYAILKRVGWTQSELARQTGYSPSEIGEIINLVKRPSGEVANAIQKALGTVGEFFDVLSEWPESFSGLKKGYKREQTEEIQMERLLDHPEILQIPEETEDNNVGLTKRIEDAMGDLSFRERTVLRKRFFDQETFQSLADEFGVSREAIRCIEQKALRHLRHPSRLKKLAEEL